jgi:SAM-dependent methyltransferase
LTQNSHGMLHVTLVCTSLPIISEFEGMLMWAGGKGSAGGRGPGGPVGRWAGWASGQPIGQPWPALASGQINNSAPSSVFASKSCTCMRRRRASRPEQQRAEASASRTLSPGDGGEFYDKIEAKRYTSAAALVQEQLTERALQLLATCNPSDDARRHLMLLDIGCGSGLSSATIRRAGHMCIGFDLSLDMLKIAERSGIDVWRADMGASSPPPIRSGVFDGALSISALQWLLDLPNSDTGGIVQEPIDCFFRNLSSMLRPEAGAVCQFYPKDVAQCRSLLRSARANGFPMADMIVDCPHGNRSKKIFLRLRRGTADSQSAVDGAWGLSPCPIAWPLEATCSACVASGAASGQSPKSIQSMQTMHNRHAQRMLRLLDEAQRRAAIAGKAAARVSREGVKGGCRSGTLARAAPPIGSAAAGSGSGRVKFCHSRRSRVEAFASSLRGPIPAQRDRKRHLADAADEWTRLTPEEQLSEVEAEVALVAGLPCFRGTVAPNRDATAGTRPLHVESCDDSPEGAIGGGLRCRVCDCVIKGGMDKFEQHVRGAKHRKRKRKKGCCIEERHREGSSKRRR